MKAEDSDEQMSSTKRKWAAVTTALVVPWDGLVGKLCHVAAERCPWHCCHHCLIHQRLLLLPLEPSASLSRLLQTHGSQIQMVEPGSCNQTLMSKGWGSLSYQDQANKDSPT